MTIAFRKRNRLALSTPAQATIVQLTGDVLECVPRYVSVLAEHLQVEHRALAVARVELVRDVPAERAELLALLDHGVEHAHAEQHRAPVLAQHWRATEK